MSNEQSSNELSSPNELSSSVPDQPAGLQVELVDATIYELTDFINGVLRLELNRPLPSRCITVKLKCVGESQWRLLPANSQPDRSLKERHIFLNTDYSVEKNYKPICEPGLHRIPFTFQLTDKKLPPSFFEENNNGFICYYITVSVFDEEDREKLLLKTAPLYLKVQIGLARDDLRLPIGTNASKEFGNFCFFKKAKVQAYMYISKKGYVTGESVPIELHIINNSPHKVSSIVTLYQVQCFFCKNRQHIVEHHFEELSGSTVMKGKDVQETIHLTIPDACIVSFKTPIIMVSYFIHLSLHITKSIDLVASLPIIITTKKLLELG